MSAFAGKGLFTTSDAGSASGHPCDWYAVQRDPEGDNGIVDNPGRRCFWQARPTQEVADEANQRGIPYIAQAESQPELERALALDLTVPKALVGNAGAWEPAGFKAAAAQRWDYISEWYWNAHPWEHEPDAHNYPRFVNVCFGIYAEGDVPQLALADYRAVWHGSFSVWKAEAMTAADWQAFRA